MTNNTGIRFGDRIATLGLTGTDVLALHGVEACRAGTDHVKIPCPGHADEHPSCSVHTKYGRARCFVCGFRAGDAVALHRALGGFSTMGAALRDLERHSGRPIPPLVIGSAQGGSRSSGARPVGAMVVVARWEYRLANGTLAFLVLRLQWRLPDGSWWKKPGAEKAHKIYMPAHPTGSPRLMPEPFASGALRPLFGLPELLAAHPTIPVYVVEGEPAATALRSIGWVATTSSGGCSIPEKTDWSPLVGRRVIVWPDNDEPGRRYAESVTEILRTQDPRSNVTWVNASKLDLPSGGDAVDWIARRTSNV